MILQNASALEILIGTSGYDYPEWKGVFYPADLKRKDFLPYYSTVFNALELNSTFYNMPTAGRLLSFYERSEARVQFSIKANKLLTHEVGKGWKNAAEDFKTAVLPLQEKSALSTVLFQFPQSFHYTKENRIYLADLLDEFKPFCVAIEFRHAEWIRESVFEGLEERGAGLAYCDMPNLRNLPDGKTLCTPFVGANAYIRLHGRNDGAWYAHAPKEQTSIASTHANSSKTTYTAGESVNGSARYCYDYRDDELKEFVPVIQRAVSERKKVQAYFNNHPNGSGAKNALRLREMIYENANLL